MAYPFIIQLQVVLTANAQGSMRYTVPNTEKVTIKQIIHKSTGAFNLIDISDTSGRHYTNASNATPIPNTVIASGANANNALFDLGLAIDLEGGVGFQLDVVDTSGSGNTVQISLLGERDSA